MSRILKININGLFGFLDHKIELSDEGVTFVHGPNGCGKTTVLKIISYFFDGDFVEVSRARFDSLEVYYADGCVVKAVKGVKQDKQDKQDKAYRHARPKRQSDLTISLASMVNGNKDVKNYDASSYGREGEISPAVIDDFVPFLRRVGSRIWLDSRTGEHYSYSEVLERFSGHLPMHPSNKRPDWLVERLDSAKLHFVQTQRLLKVSVESTSHREARNFTNVIDAYSEEIKAKISELLAQSAALSQSRDRSFPQRLLSMKLDESYSEEKIRIDYAATEEKIQKLMGVWAY